MQGNTLKIMGLLKWLFTRIKTLWNLRMQITRFWKAKQSLTECLLLTKCNEITLSQFEQCYIYENIGVLIVKGTPMAEQILTTWDKIQQEYCDLTGDEDFKDYVKNKSKELRELVRMRHVRLLVAQAYWHYDDIYIDALKAYGFDETDGYVYPTDDIDAYHACLDRILMSFINDEMYLETIQESIKKYTENAKGGTMADNFFDDALVRITTGLKLGFLLTKDITVTQYASYLTMLRKKIDHENKIANGRQ